VVRETVRRHDHSLSRIAFTNRMARLKFKLLDSRFDRGSESVKADLPPLSIGPDDLHPGEPYAPLPKTVITKEGEVSSFSSGSGYSTPLLLYAESDFYGRSTPCKTLWLP
jgi:hypothetical protein